MVIRECGTPAEIAWEVVPSLKHLFSSNGAPSLLALDIPIGLPEIGSRACDLQARKLLGRGRASSVFPAPIRPLLAASSHREASDIRYAVEGKRLPIQAWAIVPKIREVDEFLRADVGARGRVHEVHPEVCFYYMGGARPMPVAKKKLAGREQRAALLRAHFGGVIDAALADRRRLGCAADDILDAFAGLWTARRVRAGNAVTVPYTPELDQYGLPMEMVA